MICKLNLNINSQSGGDIHLRYNDRNRKMEVSVVVSDVSHMRSLLLKVKDLIGELGVRPNYKNFNKEVRFEMRKQVDSIFNVEDKVGKLVDVVKKYMETYGKYPRFTDVEKANNYISNIVGDIEEVDVIRERILFSC